MRGRMATPVIALDVMGGDYAPHHEIQAAVEAVQKWNVRILLVGRTEEIEPVLKKYEYPEQSIEIVHADEVIAMDEAPLPAIRRKRKSSIVIAAKLLREGVCHAVVSAGNTGAVMASMKFFVGTIEGIERPALAVVLPTRRGYTVLIDAGANIHVRPGHLAQFAIMGVTYAEYILNIPHPRVGVLSVGEEDIKGNTLVRGVHSLLRQSKLNFIGNIEGKDFFGGMADVVVCDGFVGNIVLKISESLAEMVGDLLKEEIQKRPIAKLGYLLMRPAMQAFRKRVDYSEYGGAPLLGIEGLAIICHGRSTPKAIRNAIRVSMIFAENRLVDILKNRVREYLELHKGETSQYEESV